MPVRDPSGSFEPARSYRLDGLLARVIDQDVLPVLLAYRRLRLVYRSGQRDVTCWLGVEFSNRGSSRPIDVDLLGFNGQQLYCFECKANAASLKDAQLEKLLAFSKSVEGKPCLAALAGQFSARQRQLIEANSGVIFGPTELLQA
jgi:Archaeal holliday junction resolvase (hjc)